MPILLILTIVDLVVGLALGIWVVMRLVPRIDQAASDYYGRVDKDKIDNRTLTLILLSKYGGISVGLILPLTTVVVLSVRIAGEFSES